MQALAMTVLILAGLGLFAWTANRRWRLMRAATAPANRSDQPGRRLGLVLRYVFGQARMFRYRAAGIAHAMIFAGFVVLSLRTLILMARGYSSDPHFSFWIFGHDQVPLGVLYNFAKDLLSVLVIAGVAYFLYTRLVTRPRRMTLSPEGIGILCMILGLMVCDLAYEASGFVRESRAAGAALEFHGVTPFASLLAAAFSGLPDGLLAALHHVGFWGHSIIVLAFLNVLPYGKHFHVLTVLPNVYFSRLAGIGRLTPLPDIEGRLEREETLGVKTARELSWKSVLDLYTCTECGRCSDHCPATNTGKLLSPKHLTLDLRDHMYKHEARLIGSAPARSGAGAGGAETNGDDLMLVPQTVNPEVLWACTTCGACEQECPVFITYVDKIVDMRRNLVMEQGSFPDQLQNAFRGLESVGNPYSFSNEQRAAWAEGLDVLLRSEKPDAEYLYWVGCSPSFDDRARKIARATAQLLSAAGVDFAILGPEEMCTGDPARRAGNEYLYETLARQNVETLTQHNVRKIVTTCPHCFQTIANEYPEFGGRFEVIHHTTLLAQLVREGRLKPRVSVDAEVAYHDSCYLGRYNNVYDAPRDVLRAIPGVRLHEPVQSRDRGMCCGAGGAQMWKEDEPVRRPGSREGDGKVNHARTRQLLKVLPAERPRMVASACPFCMTMLRDGLADQGHTDVEQLDVAELLLRSVQAQPRGAPG